MITSEEIRMARECGVSRVRRVIVRAEKDGSCTRLHLECGHVSERFPTDYPAGIAITCHACEQELKSAAR